MEDGENIGKVIFLNRGNYKPTDTYNKLDTVRYNGSSYVCIKNNTTKKPTNQEYWQLIAPVGAYNPTIDENGYLV